MTSREDLYNQCVCPSCNGLMQHLPEAPGSDEGKRCLKCGKVWSWWRHHRKGGRKVIPYGNPSMWMRVQDVWKYKTFIFLWHNYNS